MIYCNLKGGLGNMLFQIATTKSFSIDMGVECSFPNLHTNIISLNNDQYHNPKLKHGLEYLNIFKNLKIDSPKNYVNKIVFPFHYEKLNLNDGDLVDGFFQSEKYFKHNKSEILNFINFEDISKNVHKKYEFLINIKNTTSIHIRRGDYVKLHNHHPPQTLDYYKQSINEVKNKTDMFIIFSDDIDWCKENLNLDNSIYISNEKDYNELYLMSLCRNNIISNSSFSWWGAWMNSNEQKIVIGPKRWFGPMITHNTNDILPKEWIKI